VGDTLNTPALALYRANRRESGETMPNTPRRSKQLLHLVFGGELRSVSDIDFKDPAKLDIVGIY
jgi:Domain of unknown function (DUF4170)